MLALDQHESGPSDRVVAGTVAQDDVVGDAMSARNNEKDCSGVKAHPVVRHAAGYCGLHFFGGPKLELHMFLGSLIISIFRKILASTQSVLPLQHKTCMPTFFTGPTLPYQF